MKTKKLFNWLTWGIIFYVDGRAISFEKDSIPFTEEIIIRRGYDLIERFSDEKEFLISWARELYLNARGKLLHY